MKTYPININTYTSVTSIILHQNYDLFIHDVHLSTFIIIDKISNQVLQNNIYL